MTYRLLALRSDGSFLEEEAAGSGLHLRINAILEDPAVDAVRVFEGKAIIATVQRPAPLRHTVLTRLQMYARRLDADAALGFTRD